MSTNDTLRGLLVSALTIVEIHAEVLDQIDAEEDDKAFTREVLAELKAALAEPVSGVALAPSREGRVYLAGPMTGIADYNFPAFNAEAARLRKQGLHVENPAEHGIVEGAEWGDYLRYDIGRLATVERIHLLPGWSKSSGARLEVSIAKSLGMHVWYAEGAEHVDDVAALNGGAVAGQAEPGAGDGFVLMPVQCPSWLEDEYDEAVAAIGHQHGLYLPGYDAMVKALQERSQ